jgi:hypothetical protein
MKNKLRDKEETHKKAGKNEESQKMQAEVMRLKSQQVKQSCISLLFVDFQNPG